MPNSARFEANSRLARGLDRLPGVSPVCETFDHVAQELRRSKRVPVPIRLQQQGTARVAAEGFQPRARLGFRMSADGNRNVDWNGAPDKACRKKDDIGFVGTHPVGQRACRRKPAADEIPAGIDRTLVVDRAFARAAERARLPRMDVVATNPDFQPAIAASGALATSSRCRAGFGRHASSVPMPHRIQKACDLPEVRLALCPAQPHAEPAGEFLRVLPGDAARA